MKLKKKVDEGVVSLGVDGLKKSLTWMRSLVKGGERNEVRMKVLLGHELTIVDGLK